MMTVTEKMIALMRRLKIEMNGAVAEGMASRLSGEGVGVQGSYGLNYGVSAITIRDVVGEMGWTGADHELAELLWKQDVRELKIAAVYVEDAGEVTREQMERWSGDWVTGELVEQCAMQLFWRAEGAVETAMEWLEGVVAAESNGFRRLGAYYMIGKNAERLEEWPDVFDHRTAESSATYALREIYRRNEGMRVEVLRVLEKIPAAVAEEVRWQMEYLNEN